MGAGPGERVEVAVHPEMKYYTLEIRKIGVR